MKLEVETISERLSAAMKKASTGGEEAQKELLQALGLALLALLAKR